ncbi:unnamed protein product [Menidia menidia]|uniref:(Atlantic silverside) hypothetical protein n=1 Tax=Menidia menidia TaxID=238744 RepID=A0A8S4AQN1_9TELE|nr:unnamed protein product [Menidia menidia]
MFRHVEYAGGDKTAGAALVPGADRPSSCPASPCPGVLCVADEEAAGQREEGFDAGGRDAVEEKEVCAAGSDTHVDARGVKRTLGGDAGVADGVGKAAVAQEAPPTLNHGHHHRHQEAQGRGGRHEGRQQADRQQGPGLKHLKQLLFSVTTQTERELPDIKVSTGGRQRHHVGHGVVGGPGLRRRAPPPQHHAVHQRAQQEVEVAQHDQAQPHLHQGGGLLQAAATHTWGGTGWVKEPSQMMLHHQRGCMDHVRGRRVRGTAGGARKGFLHRISPVPPQHHTQTNMIEDFTNVEHHTQDRRTHHKVRENRLLRGAGYVAVHPVWTGAGVTLDSPGKLEAVVDTVEQVEKSDLKAGFGEETQQVGPPEAAVLLAGVGVELGALAVLLAVLVLPLLPIGHVQYHHEGRAGDEDELKGPEASVRDGEVVVIADVGAAWLAGVAFKVPLVIAPDPLSGDHKDQHPKDKDHRQPDPPEARHVKGHHKGGAGDEDQLEGPESGVGDGEVMVVADVVAAGLEGVAVKVLLLVRPHLLAGHKNDQQPEDENDGQPDTAKRGGILVDPAEEPLQESPVHGVVLKSH